MYYFVAGWSSLVARRAHNPKVASSNLAPATNDIKGLQALACNPFIIYGFFFFVLFLTFLIHLGYTLMKV